NTRLGRTVWPLVACLAGLVAAMAGQAKDAQGSVVLVLTIVFSTLLDFALGIHWRVFSIGTPAVRAARFQTLSRILACSPTCLQLSLVRALVFMGALIHLGTQDHSARWLTALGAVLYSTVPVS